MQVMKEMCRDQYEQETAEQEYQLLQRQILQCNSSHPTFECAPIVPLQTDVQRQQLLDQYQAIAIQSRTTLFEQYLTSAAEQRDTCRKNYEAYVKQMWSDRGAHDGTMKLLLVLIQLIDLRCQKIRERIQCIYQFKAQSLRS